TALKLQLASLARRERIDSPADAFTTPIDLAEEALRHTRDLSASLHPHLLDDLGLEPALNWLIDRFIRPSVPQVELRCRLEPARGPESSELVAFRVVQEALTNVVRHADATRVGVMLESDNGELTIEVIDDGVGFDAGVSWFDLQRSTSLGVTSMRDRVNEIGGDLHMDSRLGSGTSLLVHLPW
ncbi:MAG: ATP-binding protein, partial [Ramlibacter sp.]